MIYLFDLDNTLCETNGNDYINAKPLIKRIAFVNELYHEGHIIRIFTARCMSRCNGDISKVYDTIYKVTKDQLIEWGICHHDLILGKPSNDIIVDDKAINDKHFFKREGKTGVIAGSFDLLHFGYMKMFKDITRHCDYLRVCLHVDPSTERPTKHSPIFSIEERQEALLCIKGIEEVYTYHTEKELYTLLKWFNSDIHFAGDDYIRKNFTGKDIAKEIVYLDRTHGWSTTKLKQLIYDSKH